MGSVILYVGLSLILLIVFDVNCELLISVTCIDSEHWSSGRWRGVTLANMSVPGYQVTIKYAVSESWTIKPCCQRIHVKLKQQSKRSMFPPQASWTECSTQRNLSCVVQGDLGSRAVDSKRAPWVINFNYCFNGRGTQFEYDLDIFPHTRTGDPSTEKITGLVDLKLIKSNTPVAQNTEMRRCIFEGRLDILSGWRDLLTLIVRRGDYFIYLFKYSISKPTNDKYVTALFYPRLGLSGVNPLVKCANKVAYLQKTFGESNWPLTLWNMRSGCAIENSGGSPTYVCTGGRNFIRDDDFYISVSNCDSSVVYNLEYRIELTTSALCPHSYTGCATVFSLCEISVWIFVLSFTAFQTFCIES